MSSSSRPPTTGTSNLQPGQSPAKSSQVDSTNQPPNVAQPPYQNNPNQQFIPNSIPLMNTAQQLQFQSQLTTIQQTAAFMQQRQQLQLMQEQEQSSSQLVNSMESQLKNQTMNNGPFPNFPELLNFFLLSNPNLNIPLPQLNTAQPPVQQPSLQTPKTVPISPSKSVQSVQHAPRSATTGPRSMPTNINSAADMNFSSSTSAIPSTVSAHNTDVSNASSKQLLTSPIRSSSVSTVSTPSSTISERLMDEVKERINLLSHGSTTKKNSHDDLASNNKLTSPSSGMDHDTVTSSEATKSTVPRRKQTNVTAPLKANPIVSPSHPTVSPNSSTFSTPKKSDDVKSASNSPATPAAATSMTSVPSTPTTPPDKKPKATTVTKKEPVQKSPKKIEVESKPATVNDDQKPEMSNAPKSQAVAGSSSSSVPNEPETKTKRNRMKTNLYQSPTPELVLATKMSVSEANRNSVGPKDKLIIFFADEFIAVRNHEGGFYLCQCGHNMYRTSKKCRVRWLNKEDNSEDTYKLSFFDHIDKECILTSVSMESVKDNGYKLTEAERERIDNILKKSIDVEKGILPRPEVTEENPDGLDISLYKDESQIKTDDQPTSSKRKSDGGSGGKSVSPTKKVKQNTKTSKNRSPNRRKTNNSSDVESPKNKKKSAKQSKKNVQRTPNSSKKSDPSTNANEPRADADKKKVVKTKKPKSPAATPSRGAERTLRKRN